MRIDKGLNIRVNLEGCLASRIGKHGLDEDEVAHWLNCMTPHMQRLSKMVRDGELELATVLNRTEDIEKCRNALKTLSYGAQNLIFFGTGGSSLGGKR